MRPVAIAGAGIGGLTTALTLAANGIACCVLEKSAELSAIGAGVQLSPNASRILIGLGLRDALAASAIQPVAVSLNSVRAGGEIARLPLEQKHDAPYWVIHRADLQATLRAAVDNQPAIALRLDAEVDAFRAHRDGLSVVLRDDTLEASALIAADGVGSRIRQTMFAGSAPVASGRSAWRGLASQRGDATLPMVQLWMGTGAHLVAYPVAGGTQTNLVITLPDDTDDVAHRPGKDIAVRLAQAGWPRTLCDLIRSSPILMRYPLLTAPMLPAWNVGPVALLGDAAHAMLPFAAQGAAMAIEDAAVLAQCLRDNPDNVPATLQRYANLRKPRVTHVTRAAMQSGRIYHLRGSMAFARDATIRALGGRRLLRRQNWIYDWRV